MLRPICLAAALLVAASEVVWAQDAELAAEEVAPVATGPALEASVLEAAVRIDALTIPTPGELLTAIGKVAQPNWQSQYRPPIPTSFTSRAQLALNLGGLIADGYLAVQAADSQQVKNVGKDIVTLARALGVSENVLSRGNSISDFADRNEWNILREELEATQNEVKLAMTEQNDKDLVILVSLGGWIRGTEIVSSWIAENYDPAPAKLLRQPAIVGFMRSQIDQLPEKLQDDKLVKKVKDRLEDIEKLVSFPAGDPPPREKVDELRVASSQLIRELTEKSTP